MVKVAPVAVAPASKQALTRSSRAKSRSRVLDLTTNIPALYECMMLGREPPFVICPNTCQLGRICHSSHHLDLPRHFLTGQVLLTLYDIVWPSLLAENRDRIIYSYNISDLFFDAEEPNKQAVIRPSSALMPSHGAAAACASLP